MFKTNRLTVSSLLAPVALITLVGTSGVANADAIIENAVFSVDATPLDPPAVVTGTSGSGAGEAAYCSLSNGTVARS